ncbi:PHD finger protein 14 isoform X2 [Agrilus planipennis]|uniref:PHD finger protein 14 isoform X2 n=1 Tax=Agrilus planipennis TaxID=224129 RepID=A0A1W4XDE3_AGRPL|nr:PHD finger protein 14 isoform X2 [Agrilus planipennis]
MSVLENAEDVDFITKTAIERDPKKRRVKPIETQASILDFDLGESSDDSDFRIEDHPDISDDDSLDTNEEDNESSEMEESECEESDEDDLKNIKLSSNGLSVTDVLQKASLQSDINLQLDESNCNSQLLICCGCLGDQSDSVNEIVECDSCGATVHEACYGISDIASTGSTDSLCPTAPWFCEACKAGITNPTCELCPNSGGVFKETDVGKWVHLVCALYVPGVAFGEVDKLSSVTLFEMPYSKWGAKICSLCHDDRFARTGVCIGCDAGMCRTYFHVTCAQREGLLSEAHSEEADQADPFYAHCKLHSDKTLVKKRKRNYLALQQRNFYRKLQLQRGNMDNGPEQQRIHRKLEQQKAHYFNLKSIKIPPWVPTQKMPRLLTTSASACKKLFRKAEIMGIDSSCLEMQETQLTALIDVRKKWHISPAFSVEFIAYYLDRNDRLKTMKAGLEKLLEQNSVLLEEQRHLRTNYDQLLKESSDESKISMKLKQIIHKFHSAILSACPTKNLPNIDDLGKPVAIRAPQQMMVPTAAALKMGVGFPLTSIASARNDSARVLSSQVKQVPDPLPLNECGICSQRGDQHLLAKCDTCCLYYHLNCLNPPLTRLPKKSKLYGWQCSECDKTSDSEAEQVKMPRRSRVQQTKESKYDHEFYTPKVKIKPVEPSLFPSESIPVHVKSSLFSSDSTSNFVNPDALDLNSKQVDLNIPSDPLKDPLLSTGTDGEMMVISSKSGKKRRREKHRSRYSPTLEGSSKEHKRKRKKKSLDIDEVPTPHPRITIKIRPIPLPAGQTVSSTNPQRFYVPDENAPPILSKNEAEHSAIQKLTSSISDARKNVVNSKKKIEYPPPINMCDVCKGEGNNTNLVSCDECQKCYHFGCLEPPLKKSPKKRGYSWHCEDCDPTASESN